MMDTSDYPSSAQSEPDARASGANDARRVEAVIDSQLDSIERLLSAVIAEDWTAVAAASRDLAALTARRRRASKSCAKRATSSTSSVCARIRIAPTRSSRNIWPIYWPPAARSARTGRLRPSASSMLNGRVPPAGLSSSGTLCTASHCWASQQWHPSGLYRTDVQGRQSFRFSLFGRAHLARASSSQVSACLAQ